MSLTSYWIVLHLAPGSPSLSIWELILRLCHEMTLYKFNIMHTASLRWTGTELSSLFFSLLHYKMHFSSCPGYLCLKIEWNHVKKVMWDIGEKEPDVTFSDFHLWVVFSQPREHRNPIKEVSIGSYHLTVDRRTGGLQFTSLCGLSWFGVVFKWISTFKIL